MFEAPQYQGAIPPPYDPRLLNAADKVCSALMLPPFDAINLPDGSFVSRRDLIAADCALLMLMVRALQEQGFEVGLHG